MKLNNLAIALTFGAWLSLAVSPALIEAQDIKPTSKQELIQELILLFGGDKLLQNVLDGAIQGSQNRMLEMLLQEIDKKDIGKQEREEAKREAEAFVAYYIQRVRELIPLRLNMDTSLQQMAQVYDKYFSEDDLKVMISYQRTPTGRKAIRLMSQIMQESVQVVHQSLGPQMEALIQEAVEDTRSKFKKIPTETN